MAKYILYNRPPRIVRQNFLLSISRIGSFTLFIIGLVAVFLLLIDKQFEAAATIFVFTFGVTGYIFNNFITRQLTLNEVSNNVTALLRERWDALRADEDLLRVFSESKESETELDSRIKLKLRLYLSTFLDIYVIIIRYIRYGYFDPKTEIELADVFERMLKSLFEYPYIRDVWESKDKYGKGCLRDEYSGSTLYVIEQIVNEIAKNEQASQEGT